MPFRTLEVELGGLCMLVMRTNVPEAQKGLYVLMPDNHHHEKERHCPLFVVEGKHTSNGKPKFEHLRLEEKSDEVDLRFMAPHTPSPPGLPDFVANVSTFYGVDKRHVDSACFDGVKKAGLAARIILPLPKSIVSLGAEPALFWVPTKTATPGFRSADLYGQCRLTYAVRKDIDDFWKTYQVKGVELKPEMRPDPDGPTIRMYFVNTRPKDLNGARYTHAAGETWQHPQAYHDLLVDGSSERGPRAILRGSYNGDSDEHKNEKCRDVAIAWWPPVVRGQARAFFIDPYTCTLGGGCEENDPAC